MPELMCIITGSRRVPRSDGSYRVYRKFECITPDVVTAADIVYYLNNTQTKWEYAWDYVDCYKNIKDYHYYESL